MKKEKAYLFGPFIGKVDWEFYRFAPFAIHLKKKEPNTKLIVLTRPSRFDLYGLYADILINLNIEDDITEEQDCFKSNSVSINRYYNLVKLFKNKYKKTYDIQGHFYPDIKQYRYKLKWQFPRNMMNYDFKPRNSNELLLNKIMSDSTCSTLIDFSWVENDDLKNELYNDLYKLNKPYINYENIMIDINNSIQNNQSVIGLFILLLRRMKLVIGNVKESPLTKLSLLLKTPIITINEELSKDSISILNPFKTNVRFYYTHGDKF